MFLDRDGTLIELVHYLVDPADVKLLHGAAMAINRWKDAGYACVVVTNQSKKGEKLISIAKEVQCYVINVVGIKELACELRGFKAYKFSENQQCLVNICKAVRNAYAHSSLLIPSYKAKCIKGSCVES